MSKMNEKKKRILEESIKLFSQKGYHATSIQEIVANSDVSKGAFYLYFDSKEALTGEIFAYYSAKILQKAVCIQQQDIDAEAKLKEQVKMFIDLISEHKEYVMMHLRDNLQLNSDIGELAINLNTQWFQLIQSGIQELYGEKTKPYLADIYILLDGLLQGYLKVIVLYDLRVDSEHLAQFIFDRLDDMIKGMVNTNASPQVTAELLSHQMSDLEANVNRSVEEQLLQLTTAIKQLDIENEQKQQLVETVAIIEQEWKKKQANPVIIRGMLAQLATIKSLKRKTGELEDSLDIKIKRN